MDEESISSELHDRKGVSAEVNTTILFTLLLACCLFIFILPLFDFALVQLVKNIVFTLIVVLAASVVYPPNRFRVGFALLVILIEWITYFSDFIYIQFLAELTSNIFLVWVVVTFVLQIMKRTKVTILTLVEALLGYLLLGIMFTSLVAFIDLHTVDAFSKIFESDFDRGYYTLVTLTTTGYGDITPTLPITKSLSLVIAICGQFYVAVIVAIIVGKYSNLLSS